MYLSSPFFEWGTWEAEMLSKVPQLLGSRAGWKKKWKSCLTLCNPMDCSLPGSSVHGISQSRILEWVVISFSRGSSWPGDQTLVTGSLQNFYHCRQILYHLSHQGSPSRAGTWSQIHLTSKSTLLLGRALLFKAIVSMICPCCTVFCGGFFCHYFHFAFFLFYNCSWCSF